MFKIPTKKDWKKYLRFRKRISIELIVEKVMNSSDYKRAIEESKKTIAKDEKFIKKAIKLSERLDKSIKNN